VAVPTEILKKEGNLDPQENIAMQKHTTIGTTILKDIEENGDYNDFVSMAKDIAHYHHESWDGTGYPDGIRGDNIPLCAQIVNIAGAYCSLTEKRTYGDAYSREEALKIMEDESGKKFNPEILDILHKISKQLH
jgi:putative two-component system response regulator